MQLPEVTLVIPCREGQHEIIAREAVKSLDYPEEKIEVLVERGSNPPEQRNKAVKKSKGEIIAFIDDDCVMERDWLKNGLKFFENDHVGVVGGPNLTPPTDSFLSHCFGYAMASFFGTGPMSKRYKKAVFMENSSERDLILANMLCRREIFESGIFFNEELFPNEENEFMNRVVKEDILLQYSPHFFVYHPRKKTLSELFKQFFGYGRGRAQQSIIQPSSFNILYVLPTLFTIGLLGLFVSSMFGLKIANLLLLFGLLSYLIIAIIISSIKAFETKNVKLLFILPLVFLTMHIGYGSGFISRMVKLNWNKHSASLKRNYNAICNQIYSLFYPW
ncbi:MAG: glycosyltransferase [Candidatus Hodarchaeales archaeon]|jgi:GT2 family glycosyltransferase